MSKLIIEIIDNLTFEVVENVELDVNNIKKITVLTSDLETTKVNIVTKEDE